MPKSLVLQTSSEADPPLEDASCSAIIRTRAAIIIVALAGLWIVLARHLSGEWSSNEQYSYGWFVPFFAIYLFWLRWEDRPAPSPPRRKSASIALFVLGAVCLLALFPIRVFEIAAPDWRPLGWLHAAAVVTLTCVCLCYLGGKPWLRHFSFPVGFFLVAVPWLVWFEGGTTNHLMRIVASIAAEIVALCGIPAQVEGSVIRLTTGVVGVSEACSGVRSLQTSLMIGLLFGELKRFGSSRRMMLLGAAVVIAFWANVCRTVFLVYVASSDGIPAVSKWHDFAGYTIVGVVFVGTVAVAAALDRHQRSRILSSRDTGRSSTSWSPRLPALATSSVVLAWLLLVELGAYGWYRMHDSDSVSRQHWSVRWPESAPKFRDIPVDQFHRTLVFDEGRGAAWSWRDDAAQTGEAAGSSVNCLLYFFHWEPGRSSVLRARGHQPDQCLPNAGWRQTSDHGTRAYRSGDISLPFHHFEFIRQPPNGRPPQFAHAFYCVRADAVKPQSEGGSEEKRMHLTRDLETRLDFVRAVREGERNLGQQVMEFIIVSGYNMDAAEAESRFAKFVRESVYPVTTPASRPPAAAKQR